MIREVLILTVVTVFVVDFSGFPERFKSSLFRLVTGSGTGYRTYRLRPFDCSLCMTFWTVLGYLIFISNREVVDALFMASLAAFSARWMGMLLQVTHALVTGGMEWILKKTGLYDG